MNFPRFNELTAQDKARDWKAGITPQEYSEAKVARKEMIGHLAARTPHVPVKRKSWKERMAQRARNFKLN